MKVANKDLKGTMKTLKIEDIDVRSSITYFHAIQPNPSIGDHNVTYVWE